MDQSQIRNHLPSPEAFEAVASRIELLIKKYGDTVVVNVNREGKDFILDAERNRYTFAGLATAYLYACDLDDAAVVEKDGEFITRAKNPFTGEWAESRAHAGELLFEKDLGFGTDIRLLDWADKCFHIWGLYGKWLFIRSVSWVENPNEDLHLTDVVVHLRKVAEKIRIEKTTNDE